MIDILLRATAAFFGIWFLVVFLLLIHESGHIIALASFKLKLDKVVIGNVKIFKIVMRGVSYEFGLFPFFAFTISEAYAKAPSQQRAIVAVVGPATSIILGLLLYAWESQVPGWYTKMAAEASIALGILNLIPFPPMDGWPILEWQLNRMGVKITDNGRKVLLGVGITLIAVISVFPPFR